MSFRLGPGFSTVSADPRTGHVHAAGPGVKGIHVLTRDGKLVGRIGRASFNELATNGRTVYAADLRTVRVFDAYNGTLLTAISCVSPPWNMSHCQLAVDPSGDLYVGRECLGTRPGLAWTLVGLLECDFGRTLLRLRLSHRVQRGSTPCPL